MKNLILLFSVVLLISRFSLLSASSAYGLDEAVYSVKGVTPLPRDGDRIEIKADVYLSDLEVSRVVMAIDEDVFSVEDVFVDGIYFYNDRDERSYLDVEYEQEPFEKWCIELRGYTVERNSILVRIYFAEKGFVYASYYFSNDEGLGYDHFFDGSKLYFSQANYWDARKEKIQKCVLELDIPTTHELEPRVLPPEVVLPPGKTIDPFSGEVFNEGN